jgi:8-oxo-dGTP diphosphatase
VSNNLPREYPERPILAGLAVARRGDRVLLAHRNKGPMPRRWGFPGGMHEIGETIEACAARELLEETGIEAEPRSVLSAFNIIARDDAGRVRTHYLLVAVLLEWRQGEGAPIEDASEVRWLTVAEAEALDTFPDALPLMRQVLAR